MFKNLKSLFVVEDEETDKKSPKDSSAATDKKSTSTPSAKPGKQAVSGKSAAPGKITEKFNKILLGAMEKNNIEGFDYLEYRQSLISLRKMDMDTPTRYKSAYAMAQTMGASPDYLIKTAQHYLDVLQKEESKFEEALKNQQSRQIGEKQNQLKQLNQLIKEKAKKIQQLSKEIEQHQAQIKKMEGEVSNATVKVETTKNNFIASYHAIVVQIKEDVENMQKYLK